MRMNSIFPTTRWPDDRFSSTANGGALILSTKIAASVWDLVARCIAVAPDIAAGTRPCTGWLHAGRAPGRYPRADANVLRAQPAWLRHAQSWHGIPLGLARFFGREGDDSQRRCLTVWTASHCVLSPACGSIDPGPPDQFTTSTIETRPKPRVTSLSWHGGRVSGTRQPSPTNGR